MNKEQAYDEKINPLMAKIIAICQEHGISMISSFAIPTDVDDGLRCTTCLPDENGKNADGHLDALRILRFGSSHQAIHLKTDHGDGRVTMTAIL